MLEKTLEQQDQTSPKEHWILIGRTDAEAEAPIPWSPDVKSQFIGKDSDAGKDWRQEEEEMTTLGNNEGQKSLAFLQSMGSPRVCTTEQQNITWRLKCLRCCCCCSVAHLCLTLCNPLDCSMPGFPVLHHLLEFAQTHVHLVSDTIQLSYLSPPCPPAFNLSQHQSLFQWVSSFPTTVLFTSSGQSFGASPSALVLLTNIQDWFPLGWTGWISFAVQGTLKSFSNTTVQKHQFFGPQLSL